MNAGKKPVSDGFATLATKNRAFPAESFDREHVAKCPAPQAIALNSYSFEF